MAAPDPRQGGDDQPNSQPAPNLPPIRRSDEELTRDYGPVAPEPEWRRLDEENERLQLKLSQRHHFNRERFLLRCVAWVIGVQFGFYIIATVHCAAIVRSREALVAAGKPIIPGKGFCEMLPDKLQGSADQGLAVLLALLGGGTLAASEIQRRAKKEEDPRRGGDQP